MIEVANLGKTVTTQAGPLTILDDINFTIADSEVVAIVGASGSGKSTLLSLLAGLDTLSTGSIRIDDNNLESMDEDARARLRAEKIGFIFQSFHLLPGLTALENVMLPMELAGNDKITEHARELLEKVGLGERMTHYPQQLSGGEQQRVAVARAFASEPSILFADEPTGNLDTHTGEKVIEQMMSLNADSKTTLVLVTHDDNLARNCDRQLQLQAGRLVSA